MAANPGGFFSILSCLARLGLGGTQGRGDQRLSWMHEVDFARAIELDPPVTFYPELNEPASVFWRTARLWQSARRHTEYG
jgi:hypothetical protein